MTWETLKWKIRRDPAGDEGVSPQVRAPDPAFTNGPPDQFASLCQNRSTKDTHSQNIRKYPQHMLISSYLQMSWLNMFQFLLNCMTGMASGNLAPLNCMIGMANGNFAPSLDAQGYGSTMVRAEGIGRSKESGSDLKAASNEDSS